MFAIASYAQTTTIKGQLTDRSKAPVIGANILLRNTYDGASSDANGKFQFTTEETGDQVIQITYLGFDTIFKKITLKGGTIEFNPIMQEGFNTLKMVVISAGAFEASDEKKVTVLKPLDIVTTASAGGDTYGALRTLPGAQVSSGDQSGLFVRGGTGSEAQTFIDGMLVRNPFFASQPDFASRGRFNPFLFKGTIFSTGGYSAQYGQGMSSALILDSQDLPERSAGTAGISCVGLSYGQQKLWADKGRGAGINVNYTNLSPYFWLAGKGGSFTHSPEFIGTEGFFRQKTGGNGLLKFYGYYNGGQTGYQINGPDQQKYAFDVKNNDIYTNLSWAGLIHEKWKINLGASYSDDWNKIQSSYNIGNLAPDTFHLRSALGQVRVMATRFIGKLTSIRFGAEDQYSTDVFKNQYFGTSTLHDNFTAAFAETDIYLTTSLVARVGLRSEYSTLLQKANLAPRVSLAYKLGAGDQISFAWGDFYQKGDSLLRWKAEYGTIPGFQKAEHFILNYQYIQNDRVFRVEGYYKKYTDLVTTLNGLSNNGKGYAQGIEFFFRDKKSFKNIDYWISYSYLDTKRKFWWYPEEAQPTYAANHVASFVFKKFFPKIGTGVGFTYNYSTGRPYANPNLPASEFLTDRTPAYNNLSINVNYITTIHKAFAVFVLSLSNVLNQEQTFGYRYSIDGTTKTAITPIVPRFLFFGAFISWGTDRTKEIIDNQ
jgi:hypothetical protein